jgi:hypothetical protein
MLRKRAKAGKFGGAFVHQEAVWRRGRLAQATVFSDQHQAKRSGR